MNLKNGALGNSKRKEKELTVARSESSPDSMVSGQIVFKILNYPWIFDLSPKELDKPDNYLNTEAAALRILGSRSDLKPDRATFIVEEPQTIENDSLEPRPMSVMNSVWAAWSFLQGEIEG